MLKKFLNKKKSVSDSSSSSDEEKEQIQKEKRTSIASLKSKLDGKDDKVAPIVTQSVRMRTGSSSEEDNKKKSSVTSRKKSSVTSQKKSSVTSRGMAEDHQDMRSSSPSLNNVDIKASPSSISRGSSIHSRNSFKASSTNLAGLELFTVVVHRGKNLDGKGGLGKSDPYVSVKLANTRLKSKTVSNNQNPEWNFRGEFNYNKQGKGEDKIHIEVLDDDLGKDDLLGSVSVSLLDVVSNDGMNECWLSLENCTYGEILVSVLVSQSQRPSLVSQSQRPSVVSQSQRTSLVSQSQQPSLIQNGIEKEVDHTGAIALTIHKAKKLDKKGMFGKSDPYALITFGQQKLRSKTVSNNQNPEWEFDAKIELDSDTPQINIEVYDEDKGKDDLLGVTHINVSEIINKSISKHWVKLESCKSGEVLISAQFIPPITVENITLKPVPSEVTMENITLKPVPTEVIPIGKQGELTLTIIKAQKLERAGGLGTADPYVVIKFGELTARSTTKNNEKEPEWKFLTTFTIEKDSPQKFSLEVFDDDLGKDDLLGTADIEVVKLLSWSSSPQWLPLSQSKSGGEILISASFTPHPPFSIDIVTDEIVVSKDVHEDSSSQSSSDDENNDSSTIKQDIHTGTYVITIHKARKLKKKGTFGKSDPYAVITNGQHKFRTKTVTNNQNPQWDFESRIETEPNTEWFNIEVFDEDKGKDDLLGVTKITLSEIVKQSISNKWIKLENCKSGEILISASFNPTSTSQTLTTSLDTNIKEEITTVSSEVMSVSLETNIREEITTVSSQVMSASLETNKLPTFVTGELTLTILKGQKLEKAGGLGIADPYVLVKFGELTARSITKNNEKEPEWKLLTTFTINKDSPQKVIFEVYDGDLGKDDLLGTADIEVIKLLSWSSTPQWLSLSQSDSGGKILISASFVPGMSSSSVTETIVVRKRSDSVSSSDSSSSDDSDGENGDIKILNNKLVKYINKVKLIEQTTEAWQDMMPKEKDITADIVAIKAKYEIELTVWRKKLEESLVESSAAKIAAQNLEARNKDLGDKILERDDKLTDREGRVTTLEMQISELTGKLNLIQSERDRSRESEIALKKSGEEFQILISTIRQDIDKERQTNLDLSSKFEITVNEMNFKIQLLEDQLHQEKEKSQINVSKIDFNFTSEYEKRLQTELKKLRKKYQQETERTKTELISVHLKKIEELQHSLSEERMLTITSKSQLVDCETRIDILNARVAELESVNLMLTQRAEQLTVNLQKEGEMYRSQISAKESEVNIFQLEAGRQRQEYENIRQEKLALLTEIAVYRKLISTEEQRISSTKIRAVEVFKSKVHKRSDSSSSSSDEEEGIIEKITNAVKEAF